MSVRGALAAGRGLHAALYLDTVTITRVTGRTLNIDNVYVDTVETVYTGPCRLKRPTTEPGQADVTDQAVTVRRYDLELPWDAVAAELGTDPARVLVNDVATLTASDDGWAIGVPLTVLDAGLTGTSTARHLTVEARQ
jgi:hypothetical protein